MKKLIGGLLFLVIAAVVGIVALPFLIPMETYKSEILKEIKQITGRDVLIEGDIKVEFYPSIGVQVDKVTLMNPPGFSRKEMAKLESLAVSVKLMPLLKREIIIDKFDLHKPQVYLEQNAKGVGNWEFVSQKAPVSPIKDTVQADTSAALSPSAFNLGTINITEGIFEWKDAKSGALQQLKETYLSLSLASLSSPFEVDVKALWKEKHVNFSLNLGNLADALSGKSTAFSTELNTPLASFSYQGKAHVKRDKGGISYHSSGKVSAESESLVAFGKWIGKPIDLGNNNTAKFALDGDLKLINNVVALKDASVVFDAVEAKGNFTIDVARKLPYFAGMLSTNVLDFNPFLPPQVADATKQQAAQGSQEWSTAPYDFNWLRNFEADLHLDTQGILYRDIKVGKTALSTALKGGKLDFKLKEMALYEGRGSGEVTVDARGSTPVIDKFFVLEGIQANPLLKDALDVDRLSGKADATIRLRGSGSSQRDLVASLNGGGKFVLGDGALKGHNIAQTVRNFQMKITGGEGASAAQTDFAELSATFTVNNGVFHNNDLSLLAPLLRVTGKGNISLLDRRINYGLVAKLVNSLKGQGGKEDKKGIPIPIRVTGSFDKPDYSLDIGSMAQDALQNPESIKDAVDTVKDVGKGLKEEYKGIKDTVKGLKGLLKDN